MQKNVRKQKGRLMSAEFVHDPKAAEQWMDVCVRLAKEAVLKEAKSE